MAALPVTGSSTTVTGSSTTVAGQLDDRGGELDDRGGQLDDRDGELDDRDGQLDDRGGQLDNRDGQLDNRDGQLDNRDGQLDNRDGELDDCDGRLDDRERAADNCDGRLDDGERVADDGDARLDGGKRSDSEREGAVAMVEEHSAPDPLVSNLRRCQAPIWGRNQELGEHVKQWHPGPRLQKKELPLRVHLQEDLARSPQLLRRVVRRKIVTNRTLTAPIHSAIAEDRAGGRLTNPPFSPSEKESRCYEQRYQARWREGPSRR
jgi:hypothetical protein